MASKTVPTLVAHRGYPARYPENTLVGIQAAVEAGAPWFECDVQLSSDLVPFLCHDGSLHRTAGLDRLIMEMDSKSLASVDVGEAWRFGAKYAGTHPTHLTELTEYLSRHQGVQGFIEIKSESLEHFGHEAVVQQVMQAVKTVLDRCVIISFDALSLKLARQMGAGPVGWALEDASLATAKLAAEFQPEYLFAGTRLFTEALANLKGDWQWAVYQVQDPARAVALTEQGADLVETDAIGDMLKAYA
ncbi:MAG TPA: glycerophosphodiester phosphodiesterase family protein [Gammaproteobacteria bacterium]